MNDFARMYKFLRIYNIVVVIVFASFFFVTQNKIAANGEAHNFLEHIPGTLQNGAGENFLFAVFSLALFIMFSRLYADDSLDELWQYLLLFLEINACILLMHSINMAYNGVVLLIVADLMRRQRRHHEYILLLSMIALFLIANYNLAVFKLSVVPFESYILYYNAATQMILWGIRNILTSFNTIFFVICMVLLVKSNHEEKERIQGLLNELEDANRRLRASAAQAERAAELKERNRLAREIHDTLGHTLTGLVAGLDAVIMTVDSSPDFAKKQLIKLRETAQGGMVEVRRSVNKLRPETVEKLPFRYALAKTCADFAENSGMIITFDVANWPKNLRPDEEDTIYRVVQEGLTNANRHGRAKHVGITIGVVDKNLRIIIADDGTGCDSVPIPGGFGLKHMGERLALLGGTLKYWSNGGFVIEAVLPAAE